MATNNCCVQRLAYSSVGIGDPILLIHGFGASRYSWRHLTTALAKHHQVISIDLKGFGDSPKPRDDLYSMYDQARLVRNFILDHQLQNLRIVGHSMGGAVALATSIYLQQHNPQILKKLVLVDAIAYPQDIPLFIRILATPVLGKLSLHLLPETLQVGSLLKKVYFNDKLITERDIQHYAKLLKRPNAKYALRSSARQLFPRDITDFSQQIDTLKIPALIIHAKHDEIVPLATARKLHRVIKGSFLHILDNVGHAVQEEQPQLLLPIIEPFLTKD